MESLTMLEMTDEARDMLEMIDEDQSAFAPAECAAEPELQAVSAEECAVATSKAFKECFARHLVEAELCAMKEVDRLNKAMQNLQAENQQLRKKLTHGAGGLACARVIDAHEVIDAQRFESESSETNSSGSSCSRPAGMNRTLSDILMAPDRSRKIRLANTAVREILAKHHQAHLHHHRFFKDEGLFADIVRSHAFEYGTLIAVMLNAVWIAFDLDVNGKPFQQSSPIFQFVESLFIVIFSVEMVLRFLSFKHKVYAIRDHWFLFDALLVLLMILECWVFSILFLLTSISNQRSFGVLSLLRIIRLLRVARVVRLCRMVPELKTMVEGMLAGIRSVICAATVLLTMTYTFAIFLRQLGNSTEWGKEHFATVPISVYTLLVNSMLPDNVPLLDQIGGETWYCGAIYFVFLLLTAITIMNMLIGILCDVVFRVSDEETERNRIESMSAKLKRILKSVDKDFNGYISKAEFQNIVENERAVMSLVDVGVDVGALVSDADFIFHDAGKSGLPFDEFKEEVLKFRTTSCATNGSMSATRRWLRISLNSITEKLATLETLVLRYALDNHEIHI